MTGARLLLLALLLGAAPAAAEEGEQQGYGAVRLGVFVPVQSSSDAQARFSGELAGGIRLFRWLAGELGMGLFRSRETIRRPPPADPVGTPVSVGADHDVMTLTGSLRFLQPLGRWEASLLLGGGGYRVEEGIAPDAPVAAVSPRIQWGAQAGAGLVFHPRPELAVGLDGRWFITFPSWTGAASRVQGVAILASGAFVF